MPTTRMPNAFARTAIAWPSVPRPMIPIVLPEISQASRRQPVRSAARHALLASKRLRQPPGERKEASHDVLGDRRRLDAS